MGNPPLEVVCLGREPFENGFQGTTEGPRLGKRAVLSPKSNEMTHCQLDPVGVAYGVWAEQLIGSSLMPEKVFS